jgi:DNA-binding IclR family transcriptional regulator
MAMTENSAKVLNYLKGVDGNVTSADVAEALGMEKRAVDGCFTSLVKKGLGARVEAEGLGTKDVSFLTITDDGVACDKSELSENAQKILAHLESIKGDNVTLDDVADAMDMDKRVINGAFNALVKKGYCARIAATVEAPVTVKYLTLTDDGKACDPDAE